jgi:hypothetical protein
MTKKLTPDMVIKYHKYLCKKYNTKIIDKDSAAEMELVGMFLEMMGIQDKDNFLNNYSTTIGHRIYLSYEPGSSEIPLINQVETITHEHHHVRQVNRDRLFMVKYLLDKDYRAFKEARAYTTNLEMGWWYSGKLHNIGLLAEGLRGYACGDAQIRVVKKHLKIHSAIVKQGGVENTISKQGIKWLNRRQPTIVTFGARKR